MSTAELNTKLVDSYLGFLKHLNPVGKLDLIGKLTQSVKSDLQSNENEFEESFGAWDENDDAEKLIDEIRGSHQIDLAKPFNLPITTIIDLLTKHFTAKYSAEGVSRLPVLALYAAYECLVQETKRFENKRLLTLESHTSADARSGRIGDIDVVDENGRAFEAVEVKHGIPISAQLVRDAFEKFKTTQVKRYYLLSTANISESEKESIDAEIDRIKNIHGCHVIVNGLTNSLAYYLRMIYDTALFIECYVNLVELDAALKYEHKKQWNTIISSM